MQAIHIVSIIAVALFYMTYFTKMICQRKQGVTTDQIGKGNKTKKVIIIEIFMKIATFSIVPVEIISILWDFRMWKTNLAWIGVGILWLGVLIFMIAVGTMKDSWRAGIPAKDKIDLVTDGIYRISRNPAFVGFDFMYVGLLIAFFNVIHLMFVLYAIVMLHLQILQEEQFLSKTFGEKYDFYKKKTGRYFF